MMMVMKTLRLLGAAATLRSRTGLIGPAEDQAVRDHDLTEGGTTLDGVGGKEAWGEGQELALEQAVAYALDWGAGADQAGLPESGLPGVRPVRHRDGDGGTALTQDR
jgi:hypothetical protein